jgi:S1-C subfamily serine protease
MKYLRSISFALILLFQPAMAPAEEAPTVESVFDAVVGVTAEIAPDARTARSLGPIRDGNGVVIGKDGLVLTIGYLILEAEQVIVTTSEGREVPAQIVAYDHATGFGLVRAKEPLNVAPMPLGDSDRATGGVAALAAGSNGPRFARQTRVVSRRIFTGYWEYMLEDAIFTMPPYAVYGGAALIDDRGQLIGIGSLLVNDAAEPGKQGMGNMFVPINLLKPILDEMVARGRAGEPRAWLGMQTEEAPVGGLYVKRVSTDGPAFKAGVTPGSILLGLEGKPIEGQEDFYRRLWAAARPGDPVRVILLDHSGEAREMEIIAGDRYDWLQGMPSK